MSEGASLAPVPTRGDIVAAKYRIGDVLGSGGMGVVVAATHVQLGQPLAIKFVRAHATLGSTALRRFLREARAVSALMSEHVVRVHDVGTLNDGTPFLVMERLAGRDLGAVLERDGTLPVDIAVEYILQAIEALVEAHARGIVHRDLKPQNLFLTERVDGTALIKVLDFGIAKSDQPSLGEATLTMPGQIVGSPHYMSPEQLKDAANADVRADVWALGVVLYRLVSGSYPFDGDTLTELSARIAADPPIPLDRHLPEASETLRTVIARALEKDPARRFPSVAALAEALSPLATPAASASIERVQRIERISKQGALKPLLEDADSGGDTTADYSGSADAKPSPLADAPTVVAPVSDETRSAWDKPPVTRARRWPIWAALSASVVAAIAIGLWRSNTPEPEPARPAPERSIDQPATNATLTPRPEPTPPASVAPEPVSSAATKEPKTTRVAKPKPIGAASAPAASATPAASARDVWGERK